MRVIVSNLAPIGPAEREFFTRLCASLKSHGCEVLFWTTAELGTKIDGEVLRTHWDLARSFGEREGTKSDTGPSLYRIDVAKWRPRLLRLIKQGFAPAQADDVLRRLAAFSWRILREFQPDLMLVWNPLCPHIGVASDLAATLGVPSMLIERAMLPNTWFLEHGGLLGHSTLANRPLGEICDLLDPTLPQLGRSYLRNGVFKEFLRYPQKSAQGVIQELESARGRMGGHRVVFFPPDDSSVGFSPESHRDRLTTMPDFRSSLEASCALARHTDGLVVFKPHPSFRQPISVPQAPANHLVVDCDFRALIDWAEVVVGTGSGLEFVARAADKPLILMANEILRGKEVAYESHGSADLSQLVAAAIENQHAGLHRRNFETLVGALLRDHLVSIHAGNGRSRTPEVAVESLMRSVAPRRRAS